MKLNICHNHSAVTNLVVHLFHPRNDSYPSISRYFATSAYVNFITLVCCVGVFIAGPGSGDEASFGNVRNFVIALAAAVKNDNDKKKLAIIITYRPSSEGGQQCQWRVTVVETLFHGDRASASGITSIKLIARHATLCD